MWKKKTIKVVYYDLDNLKFQTYYKKQLSNKFFKKIMFTWDVYINFLKFKFNLNPIFYLQLKKTISTKRLIPTYIYIEPKTRQIINQQVIWNIFFYLKHHNKITIWNQHTFNLIKKQYILISKRILLHYFD